MQIEYYRMFLEKTAQLQLLPAEIKTKKDILRHVLGFTDPLYIEGQKYALSIDARSGDYLYGRLARHSKVTIAHSPEQKFKEESVEHWPHARIIINIGDDPESGQSIALEVKHSVFRTPLPVLQKLAKALNAKLYGFGHQMTINTISEEREFWDIINTHKGEVKDLTFAFDAPNLFQTQDSLNEELRTIRDETAMTKTTISLENPHGLHIDEGNHFIKEGVKYVANGGGEFRVKVKKKTYSSRHSVKSSQVDEIDIELASDDPVKFAAICDKLFSWLKS